MRTPFTKVTGAAAPLANPNIDTDVIMPKVFLKGIDRTGLAKGVFHDLRFRPDGTPNQTFVLNQPAWTDAQFIVVGPNFGCGSSREHAVWGLQQFGIRGLIGTSFAGIFFDNCANNGLLVVRLIPDQITRLLDAVADPARNRLTIDLENRTLVADGGTIEWPLPIGERLRTNLMSGLDAIGETLTRDASITSFESRYHFANPWLADAES